MTDQQIIIAVAKLDGWIFGNKSESSFADPNKQITSPCWLDERGQPARKFKDYLESHDAIIPVIEKLNAGALVVDCLQPFDIDYSLYRIATNILFATPKQLSIALIKSCGKWEE